MVAARALRTTTGVLRPNERSVLSLDRPSTSSGSGPQPHHRDVEDNNWLLHLETPPPFNRFSRKYVDGRKKNEKTEMRSGEQCSGANAHLPRKRRFYVTDNMPRRKVTTSGPKEGLLRGQIAGTVNTLTAVGCASAL